MKTHFTIAGTIIRKDVLSLFPLVVLSALIQFMDVMIVKLDLLPQLASLMPYLLLMSSFTLILSIFQLDAPASLVDDWLCRPVPKGALLTAKLALVLMTLYGARVLATFATDLYLGYSLQETLQEAFLLQNIYMMLILPVLMMIAVVTTTVVQGMGVLLGLFAAIFLIPTAFVQQPGPLDPAIGDALSVNGMGWMSMAPVKLSLLALLFACLWVVFRRRNILLGRILLVASTLLAVYLFILPMWLLPWEQVYSMQASVTARPDNDTQARMEKLSLHAEGACFPAAPLDGLTNDAAYAAARQLMGVSPWTNDQLAVIGPGGLSFITRVATQRVPRRWRVKATYVQANYFDAGGNKIALRPAAYVTGGAGEAFTHQWLLPQAELDHLVASSRPRLDLDYSIAMLKPTSFELPADGSRQKLPGLGYCSATLDKLNNRIEVDCFSAGSRPALVSAELLDIPSSRVDAAPSDFAPGLVQSVTSRRYKITVLSASLIKRPAVTVSAWQTAGFLNASVKFDGILGDDLETCPLPKSNPLTAVPMSSWSDDSPHTTSFIAVDEGVQLEILDWGGEGTPLLLVPGLGATAHTYDRLAPLLAEDYRVFALTRRGIGGSSRPDFGYDTATLSRDIVRVLDAMQVEKAVLIGSSIAGDELSYLGAENPERVAALVYLDAAYDRSNPLELDLEPSYMLPPRPPVRQEDLLSYETLLKWMERTDTDPHPEGEMLALYNISNRMLAGVPAVDMRLMEAIEAALQRPRYEDIQVPALALYATQGSAEDLMKPWYDRNDPRVREALEASFAFINSRRRPEIEKFRQGVAGAEVIEIPGASHAIFISNEAEVLAAIRGFIADNSVNSIRPSPIK